MNRLVDNCKALMVAAVESFERRVLKGEIDIDQGFKTGTHRLAANTLWNLVVSHHQDDPTSDFAQVTKSLPKSKREQFNTLHDDVKAACKVAASEVNEHAALEKANLLTGSGRSARFLRDQGNPPQTMDDGCSTSHFMLNHPQGVILLDPTSQQRDSNPPQDPPPPILSSFPVKAWDPESSTRNSRRQSSSSGGPQRAQRSKKTRKDTRERYMGLSGRPAQQGPRVKKAPPPGNNGASTLVAANSSEGGSLSTHFGPCSDSRLGSAVDSWSNSPPNLAQGNQAGFSSFEQQLAWLDNFPTVNFDLWGEEFNRLSSQSPADTLSVSDAATPSTTTSSDFFSEAASPATTDLSSREEYYSTPSLQSIGLPDSTSSFPTTAPLSSLHTAAVGFSSQQPPSTAQPDPQSVFSWSRQEPHAGMKDSDIGFWTPPVAANASASAAFTQASNNDYEHRSSNSWHQGGNPNCGTDFERSDHFPTSLAAQELNRDMSHSVSTYQPFTSNANGIAATGEGQVQAACHNSVAFNGGPDLTSNSNFFDTGTWLKEAPAVNPGSATASAFSSLDGALGYSTPSSGQFNDVFVAPPMGSPSAQNLHGGGLGSLQAPLLGYRGGVGLYGEQFSCSPGSNSVGSTLTTGYGYGDFASQVQAGAGSGYCQPVADGGRSTSASNQFDFNSPGVDLEGGRFPRSMVQRYEFI
ncbi:hypothetical protein MD484_g8879, partial [Candolleomyces efflorescens]